MIAFALVSFAFGTWLSRLGAVIILVPTTLCVWTAAALIAHAGGLSLAQAVGSIFLCSFCLQSGYLAGLAVSNRRLASLRRRVVVTPRR